MTPQESKNQYRLVTVNLSGKPDNTIYNLHTFIGLPAAAIIESRKSGEIRVVEVKYIRFLSTTQAENELKEKSVYQNKELTVI